MASDALRRAVEFWHPERPHDTTLRQFRAALDETDPAMVEAVAKAMSGNLWMYTKGSARAAIAALRDHICGEGA